MSVSVKLRKTVRTKHENSFRGKLWKLFGYNFISIPNETLCKYLIFVYWLFVKWRNTAAVNIFIKLEASTYTLVQNYLVVNSKSILYSHLRFCQYGKNFGLESQKRARGCAGYSRGGEQKHLLPSPPREAFSCFLKEFLCRRNKNRTITY